MSPYVSVAILFVLTAIVVAVMTSLNQLLGPRATSTVKEDPFECGNPPAPGGGLGRFTIKFYMPAILFIVFDLEVVFLYPWAVSFRELGFFGFAEMLVFAGILALGLAYVWRKGALEWD